MYEQEVIMINLKDTIEECVDYIENNIYKKVTLDELSAETGVSKYYLHRMFRSLTGESIMDYVQARKLTASIDELIHTDRRVIDIAMDYGFDYEQSYIRAFKKKFGCTPLKVRNEDITIMLTEKINSSDILTLDNSITYKPFFVFKQKFNIVGNKYKILSKSGDNIANSYGRDFYYNHKEKVSNSVNSHIYLGYTDWSGNGDRYTYYMPSVQVTDLKHIPEGMHGVSIPAHKYVVFRFIGFFRPEDIRGRHIGRVLVHLYRKWIFQSEFKFADTFRLEYIDTSLTKDNYCELDIYQPIE
jgi:AraC family transcriptional regulator